MEDSTAPSQQRNEGHWTISDFKAISMVDKIKQ